MSSLVSTIRGAFDFSSANHQEDKESIVNMASKTNPNPQNQDLHHQGEVKRKNRKVLGDIGNMVNIPAAAAGEVKNKPFTRNNPPKKLTTADDARVKRDELSRRKVAKSLTSALSARSKAACGLTNRLKLLNIDEADSHNELAQVEYVEDIYKFYKAAEEEIRVADYMHLQPQINAKMRSILLDWLIEVHNKFELMPETLYLTLNIVDRYLSLKIVSRNELQLVGISSMLIACKYEEIWAPEVKDFICISDNAYSREQILTMEKAILGKLEWYLTVPTPYVFLMRYIKASVPADKMMENMAFFMAELGMLDYSVSISNSPSLIAAAAVYAARLVLEKSLPWTDVLKHHTGYDEDQLKECGKLLISFSKGVAESKLKAIFKKYSHGDRCCVALLSFGKVENAIA